MLRQRNRAADCRIQAALVFDNDRSLLTRLSVLTARYLTDSECSASSRFSSAKSAGTSESCAVAALSQSSVMRSSMLGISTATDASREQTAMGIQGPP